MRRTITVTGCLGATFAAGVPARADASGIGFSRDTINVGSYRASARRLARLQRGRVAVGVLRSGASS